MNEQHSELLDRARGLAAAKALIERAVDDLLAEAVAASENIGDVAKALGIHRSTVYRRAESTEGSEH